MATQFKVTNGPNQLDLMLALFDPEPLGKTRTITFTLQGMNWPTTAVERERRSAEEAVQAEIYDEDVGPADYEIRLCSVERDLILGNLKLVGITRDRLTTVTITDYSVKKRSGSAMVKTDWICKECNTGYDESFQQHQMYGEPPICSYCYDYREQEWDDDEDNEDPLEGAVEPMGGTPSKDRPLHDRHGMLIGHVPIEDPYFDDECE